MGDSPDRATALLALALVSIVVLPLALAISAVLFRAGCALYNRMSQPERQIPWPSFGKALLIATPMVGIKLGVRALLTLGVLMSGGDASADKLIKFAASTISIPLAILATAGMAAVLLPTSYGRALLATLATYAIGFLCALVLMVVAIIVVSAMQLLRSLQ